MTIEKKPWYKSKTDWAAITGTTAAILTIITKMINGSIGIFAGLEALLIPITIILAVFGFRGLPFINRTR